MIAALLDTACGFAAASMIGPVTASYFSMNCLKPAVGRFFVAKGKTVQAGRKQIFAKAELFAENERGEMTLVATGETLLVPIAAFSSEVDTGSREEDASKLESRASVLIQLEPKL